MGHEVCAEFIPAASATKSTACTASFAAVTTASRACARS
jgi:hypothetical protein